MKNVFTLAKKELRSHFNNPTAYIVILTFLLLWEFLFFRNVFLVGEASLRGLFEFLPWIAIIIVPALTMGSLAEEKSDGTLEFLLTRPVNRLELVVGKYHGTLAFFALALLFIFPLAWSLGNFGNLDWGEVLAQYVSGVFLAAVLASLGIFISSVFSSQISAFLVSATAGFFLIIAGTDLVGSRLPLFLAPFLENLSLSNHFESMSRGVIDARDVWYFVSFSAVFLSFAYLDLVKNKYGNKKKVYRDYQTASAVLLGIVIFLNLIGAKIPGRIDLTEEKIYTLSASTKEIAGSLSDIVNISLYASDKLPSQLQPVLRETRDISEDYRLAGDGKIRISYKNPSSEPQIAKEAASLGVQPVRFNVVSQEEFQVKEGYLGVTVSYGGEHEAVPFVQNIDDLEYQLTGLIKKLTTDKKPKIGFLSGHGEKSLYADYRLLKDELEKQFELEDIKGEGEEGEYAKKMSIPEDVKTLVIAGPNQDFSEDEKKALSGFIDKGGSAFFMVDSVSVSPQTLSASVNEKSLADYLKDKIGVEVKKDLAYDLRSHETVGFGGGATRYFLPYPFWIRAVKTESASPITSKLESLTLPWPSTLETDSEVLREKGFEETKLFSTSDQAGTQSPAFDISPDKKFSSQGLSRKTLAAAFSSKNQGENQARIVVVGDADFLSDQFVGNNPSNLSFVLEVISWLSQESVLSRIKIKNLVDRKLSFENSSQQSLVKFGNLAFVLLLTAGYGGWRMTQRNRMKEKSY